VKSRLFLNIVIRKCATILELLPGKDEALLIRRNAFLILDLRLHVIDRIARLDLQGDGFAGECLDEDLHPATETKDKVQRRLFLDVVIRECATIFELLAGEDQTLLVRRDAFLVLNLRLDVVNGIGRLDLERDGLAGQRLHEDLHATAETKDQVKSRLFLDIVIRKSAAILELFASEDQALLVRWDTFLVLNLRLDVIDSVLRLDFEGNGLPRESLNEDLHSTTKTKD